MKRILATAAIVAMSATAFAGGDLDLRSGYTGYSGNTINSTTNTGVGGLGMDRARIGFSGAVGNVTGKVQLDMLTSAFATQGGYVKFAEITNKWNDNMSLSAGRLDDTGMGGFEAKKSTGDQYFTSASYMKNYYGGLRFAYNISDSNVFKLYLLNENFNASASGTAQGYGFQYDGSAGDFGYVLSYHTLPMTVTNQPTATNTYINAGISFKTGDWMFSFDYDMNTYAKQAITTAVGDGSKTSMVLMVDYNMGNWTPLLKYEMSTVKDLDETKADSNDGTLSTYAVTTGAYNLNITQYTIGTEYRSNPGDKFRYHIMYTGRTNTFDGAGAAFTNKTVTSTTVVAGFRWQADFLK